MSYRLSLALIMLSLGLFAPAAPADDVELGLSRVEQGDFAAARAAFAAAAEAGHPEAQYHLGALHHAGLGGPEDLAAAVHWYRASAAAGEPRAQLALGALHHKGKGVPQDFARALQLYRQAADAGLVAAQYNLAMMHAAGLAHAREYGAQEDLARAYQWFTLVLAQLEDEADRAAVTQNLAFLRANMSHGEILEGEQLARDWLAARRSGTGTP